jgi:glycosyltransferase involved in cell wall biosynthesis
MPARAIYYVYPQHHDVSFKYVALQYISMLRSKYTVYEIPELNYYMFTPFRNPISIIHPFFYSMYHWRDFEYAFFDQYRAKVHALLGVEVADSDQIAAEWINKANDYADAMIVNSMWSYNAYKNSGLKIPAYIVYHAYDPALERDVDFSTVDKEIQYIKKLKDEKKFKLIMISLWHSDYRKGADLFHEIALQLQKERDDIYFLVKSAAPRADFHDLRMFNITGIIPFSDMVALYKLADIYILPSRGGSFELNCLEALVAGIPCISAKGGAWTEFYDSNTEHMLVDIRDRPVVLPNNRIHVGRGVEMDPNLGVEKVLTVLDNLEEERENVRKSLYYLRKKFSYESVREQIINVVKKYEE